MSTDDQHNDIQLEEERPDTDYSSDTSSDDVIVDEEAELSSPQALKKLREKLKIAVEEKQQYLTNWQRDKAEFVNARKRDEESKAEYIKFATQKVIEDILPSLDSFDMAMANKASWESLPKEWRTGMEGIHSQLLNMLSKYEVTPFTEVGDAFDPNLHHSIANVAAEDPAKDHTVAEILQKGYKIKDKVLRPALVKVYQA